MPAAPARSACLASSTDALVDMAPTWTTTGTLSPTSSITISTWRIRSWASIRNASPVEPVRYSPPISKDNR